MERRLAAILAADAAGYSQLMARDEEAALAALSERRSIIDALIAAHGGAIFGSAGDSVIAEFPSSVEAARCAVEIQERLKALNDGLPEGQRMLFRIGVSFGDIMEEDGDFFGDGVNLAARLESLAPPGGVCLSAPVAEQLSGPLATAFAKAGRHRLKNLPKPVEVWCWPAQRAGALRRKAATAKQGQLLAAALVAAAALAVVVLYLEEPADRGLPTGPKIAVLPFSNIGAETEDAYFSAGLTNDINTLLSKFSNLFVIAPHSVKGFSGQMDCAQVRREVGADYILGGTVRRSQDQLRVTTSFTDAETCRQLDAPGPFDRDLSAQNVLDVQLEIAKKVVAEIGSADAPLFNARIQNEVRRKGPESLEAYECVLLSYWFYETFEAERHRRARACLERAVKIEPDYSLAWSRLAFSYIESKKYAIDTPPDWAELSRSAAEQALEIDPDNPDAYYALAILSQVTREDRTVFRNFAEKAIALNPNDAFVLADLGLWMGYSGAWEKGKEWVTRAKLINPKHQSWVDYIWHLHAYLQGDYAEAVAVALKMNLPDNYMVQASLTAAFAMNGEEEKAGEALAHLLEIRPDYPEDPRAPFRTRGMPEELIEGLMEGLRKAGLDVPPKTS
ncbi:adenylate/guanylate cyclase domain-containing protein [Pelagibius marinus]|uniref:adenylate/guanylate cyclase domain-containing protein n=1 Tax=Pelagibius marinus TaxID=2762760 RepID=UPI0018726BB0|nr:adenylate/guanylate cyclase domain-containing protein [Pelagibius marinus]